MANDVISDIKSRADIVEVINELGVGAFSAPTREGRFRGAHQICGSGHKNNCTVDGRSGWWKCFSCGDGGDVIDWVLHARYEGNKAMFREALTWLAGFYGVDITDGPVDAARHDAYRTLTDICWVWHEALLEMPDKIQWLQDKYGLSKQTIEDLRIGFCTGIPDGYERADLVNTGLISHKGTQPLYHRIVFPYIKGGLVVWAAGRLPYEDQADTRWMSLFKNEYVGPVLYNFDNAINRKPNEVLIFTEGLGDAAAAHQSGLRTVALGGANMTNPVIREDIHRLLKSCTDYKYIVFDSEASGRGWKGAKTLAAAIIDMGFDPYLIELPLPNKADKIDLAEFLRDGNKTALYDLMKVAVTGDASKPPSTLPYIYISECPASPEGGQVMEILRAMVGLDEFEVDKYITAIAKHTKTKATVLKKMLTQAKKERERRMSAMDEEYERSVFLAQDFIHHEDEDLWRAHTTIFVPYKESVRDGDHEIHTTVVKPVYVSTDMYGDGTWTLSRNEVLDAPSARQEDYVPSSVILMDDQNRWSIVPSRPYSFTSFVEGRVKAVSTAKLYRDVHSLIEKYVWLPDAKDTHVLAAYIFMTYVFMGIPAVPYVHLCGEKNTGKSTLLDIMSQLCFNTVPTSSLTPAVLFRLAHSTRPTFIIDEAEKLRKPPPGSNDYELMAVCLGSYANNEQARVMRCEKETLQPRAYRTYGPKLFGSINTLKDTLTSRAIKVVCIRPTPEKLMALSDWESDRDYLYDSIQDMRDRLRVWGLTRFRIYREAFDRIIRSRAPFLLTRSRQIWRPLIAVWDMVGEEEESDFGAEMLEYIRIKVDTQKNEEATNEFSHIILHTLYTLYKQHPEKAGFVKRKDGSTAICVSTAVSNIVTFLTQEKLWSEKFNRLDANFLVKKLKHISAIDGNAKSAVMRVQGVSKRVTECNFEILEAYVQEMNAIIEAYEEDKADASDD